MNYDMFHTYMNVFRFDEVKVIGKDICVDGQWIHIACMGRKKEEAYFCILEQQPALEEQPVWKVDQTRRESLLESAKESVGCAFHIKEITLGENTFELQGGSAGNIAQQAEKVQAYLFFQQMIENGWRVSEESCFYQLDWNHIGLVELRLRDSCEKLPELTGEITQLTLGPSYKSYIIQRPVKLEQGKTNELQFVLEENGEEVICYINRVCMMEPLAEERKHFDDVQYQETALQYVTKEEFEKMRKTTLEAIEADCPSGMGYFTIEYECTKENLSAQFYAVADLDHIPVPGPDGTAMIMMGGRPESETGPHGYRNHCHVVQYAVPVDTSVMETELFTVMETIPERKVY